MSRKLGKLQKQRYVVINKESYILYKICIAVQYISCIIYRLLENLLEDGEWTWSVKGFILIKRWENISKEEVYCPIADAVRSHEIRIEQWRPKEINTQTYQRQYGKYQLNYIIQLCEWVTETRRRSCGDSLTSRLRNDLIYKKD